MTAIPKLTNDTAAEAAYFDWLTGLVAEGGNSGRVKEYSDMLEFLFYQVFLFTVPNDDNRSDDGCELRKKFESRTGSRLGRQTFYRACTVLEMMIGVAERMAFFIFDPEKSEEPDAACCFWEMIDNVGFGSNNVANEQLLGKLLYRTYNRDGTGGSMFPVPGTTVDMRKVEIWYQMMLYLNERE